MKNLWLFSLLLLVGCRHDCDNYNVVTTQTISSGVSLGTSSGIVTPEPNTFALFVFGLILLFIMWKLNKKHMVNI